MLWITESGSKVARMTDEITCPVLDRPERYEYAPQVHIHNEYAIFNMYFLLIRSVQTSHKLVITMLQGEGIDMTIKQGQHYDGPQGCPLCLFKSRANWFGVASWRK